jgi:hypothetical protein
MEQFAPGAVQAAYNIEVHMNPTDKQRARLKRLLNDNEENKSAWHELSLWRNKEPPSEYEQGMVQFELFLAVYRAPDLAPISKAESRKSKAQVASIGTSLAKAAHDLQDIFSKDPQAGMQLVDNWLLYKGGCGDDTVELFEKACGDLRSVVDGLKQLSHFFDYASANIRPADATYLGKTRGKNVRQRTVIHHIAQTCKQRYGSYMHGTVAKFAGATLDEDISAEIVRSTLRDPGVKSQKITPCGQG